MEWAEYKSDRMVPYSALQWMRGRHPRAAHAAPIAPRRNREMSIDKLGAD